MISAAFKAIVEDCRRAIQRAPHFSGGWMTVQQRDESSSTNNWLNLVYPGLAERLQGRRAAAAYVAAEAAALVILFVALPDWRVLTVVGITVLAALSILDAVSAAR